jgi:hypothetical protein
MRTIAAHILPGCPYCNADHNPDNECRNKPVSIRGQVQPIPAIVKQRKCGLCGGSRGAITPYNKALTGVDYAHPSCMAKHQHDHASTTILT